MAELTGKAISELPAATSIGDSDLLALSQNGASKKVTPPVLLSGVEGEISGLSGSLATYVRPNLLDNWYFAGGGSQLGDGVFPINQRGQYIYNGAVIGIDRWRAIGNTAAVGLVSGYMRFAAGAQSDSLYQSINSDRQLAGKIVTLSMLIGNHVIGKTVQLPDTLPELTDATATVGTTLPITNYENTSFNGYGLYIRHIRSVGLCYYLTAGSTYTDSIRAIAAKLEIGSTQTLAHLDESKWVLNEMPNYSEQLARCQRFFQMFRTQSLRPTYGADCRPVMASETPTAGTITSGSVTYYTLSSDL